MEPTDGLLLSAAIGRVGVALWASAGLSAEMTHVLGSWTELATQAALLISAVLALLSKYREAKKSC